MSTPLDHPLRQTIAAMARTTDALVELARRIDEAGLGPAHEGQEIASMANSEQWEPRAVTDNAASPASPAPSSQPTPSNSQPGSSSPRRWWLNGYTNEVGESWCVYDSEKNADACGDTRHPTFQRRVVVEASAYDAAVRGRDLLRERLDAAEGIAAQYAVERDAARAQRIAAEQERDKAVADLASLRRVIWRRAPEMQRLNAAIEGRGCYDPALTVAQNALAYIEQLGEWLDKRTESANALLAERDAAVRERDVALTEVERLTRRYNKATRDLAYFRAHVLVKLEEERDALVRERDAEYRVRRLVLNALEGQGLPRVLPDKGYGVIRDANQLYERARAAERERDAARAELASARRLTPEALQKAMSGYRAARGDLRDYLRAALLAAGFQEDENG